MINSIAAVVAEMVEHDRNAQDNTILVGVRRHFLIPGSDQTALTFSNIHGVHRWLRILFANVVGQP